MSIRVKAGWQTVAPERVLLTLPQGSEVWAYYATKSAKTAMFLVFQKPGDSMWSYCFPPPLTGSGVAKTRNEAMQKVWDNWLQHDTD